MINERNDAKKRPGRKSESLLAGRTCRTDMKELPEARLYRSPLLSFSYTLLYYNDADTSKAYAALRSCSG